MHLADTYSKALSHLGARMHTPWLHMTSNVTHIPNYPLFFFGMACALYAVIWTFTHTRKLRDPLHDHPATRHMRGCPFYAWDEMDPRNGPNKWEAPSVTVETQEQIEPTRFRKVRYTLRRLGYLSFGVMFIRSTLSLTRWHEQFSRCHCKCTEACWCYVKPTKYMNLPPDQTNEWTYNESKGYWEHPSGRWADGHIVPVASSAVEAEPKKALK